MGYTTEFRGAVMIVPPLNDEERVFLNKFHDTRRMKRTNGPYYVDGSGFSGQGQDPDILGYNTPPEGQPSLWCQWVPSADGAYLQWDQGEKFYEADQWMKYLIDHFLKPNAIGKKKLPFFQNHVCNGEIEAQGEEYDDRWVLIVKDNIVSVASGNVSYSEPRRI